MAGDYCPLQPDPDGGGLYPCAQEDCAWYNEERQKCAIYLISLGTRSGGDPR